MSKVLGVLATGGVAPGINRIVYEALEGHRSAGFEKIVLFRDGFKPLEKGEYGDAVLPTLNKDSISKIKGAAVLEISNRGRLRPKMTIEKSYMD